MCRSPKACGSRVRVTLNRALAATGARLGGGADGRSLARRPVSIPVASSTRATTAAVETIIATTRVREALPAARRSTACSAEVTSSGTVSAMRRSAWRISSSLTGTVDRLRFLQDLREVATSAMDVHSRGGGRAPEQFADLPCGQILEVEEDHGGTLPRRKRRDCVEDVLVPGAVHPRRSRLPLCGAAGIVSVCCPHGEPDRHPSYPRTWTLEAAHLLPVSPQLGEGILRDVLGTGMVVADQEDVAQDGGV